MHDVKIKMYIKMFDVYLSVRCTSVDVPCTIYNARHTIVCTLIIFCTYINVRHTPNVQFIRYVILA